MAKDLKMPQFTLEKVTGKQCEDYNHMGKQQQHQQVDRTEYQAVGRLLILYNWIKGQGEDYNHMGKQQHQKVDRTDYQAVGGNFDSL